MKKLYLILILIIFLIPTVFSQNNLTKVNKDEEFTSFDEKKPDKYGEDLTTYFKSYEDLEVQKLIVDFIAAYSSYSANTKLQIIKTSNIFLKKRASKTPHFTNYFKLVMLMNQSSRSQSNYVVLETMIEDILMKQKKGMKNIEDIIKPLVLLHEKDIMFSNSGAINWVTSTKDFVLKYQKEFTIEYATTDLFCKDYTDSMRIEKTSGVFYVEQERWEGNGGKVSWEKAGLPINEVYAELGKYKIDLKKREFEIPDVSFMHTRYFSSPLKGTLNDKLQNISNKENRTYPQFEAYNNVEIKEVVQGVDYKGPFTMKGSKFYGTNSKNESAKIEVKKGDSIKVFAESRNFTFYGENIRGTNTKIKIPVQDKEIRHPGVLFHYRLEEDSVKKTSNRKIEMIRTSEGMGKSPFYNTYHNLEMDFEQILWYIDSAQIEFNNLRGVISASGMFTSLDNFDLMEYQKLQLADKQHPLLTVKKYSEAFNNTSKIDLKTLSQYMKYEQVQVSQMLLNLSYKGFITYDPETGKGEIQQRLYDYLQFKANKKDFDFLSFRSELDTVASLKSDSLTLKLATLDLNNLDLSINNVTEVPISSIHNVVCVPSDRKITMKKDRDFTFNGELRTEFIEFSGTDFYFNYDSFKVNMNSIDFLRILIRGDELGKVESQDKDFIYPYDAKAAGGKGKGIKRRYIYKDQALDSVGKERTIYLKKEIVQSRIENITGYILIDDPSNKSGVKSNEDLIADKGRIIKRDSTTIKKNVTTKKEEKKEEINYAKYPHFYCSDSSYVYYDKYYNENDAEVPILDGKYKRESFFFKLAPFDVDSLGDFTANSWRTFGNFQSGIFPNFNEYLTIQKDTIVDSFKAKETIYSLGFIKEEPESKQAYPGLGSVEAWATNKLKLSNKGLHGVGKFEYITTTLTSTNFVYFPQFMVTDASRVVVDESTSGTEYALINSVSNFVEFLPAQDSLIISGGLIVDSIMNDNWEIVRNELNVDVMREPMEMYNGDALLTGQSIITPTAHTGWGMMEFSNSELISKSFTFKANEYDGDSADFAIKPTGFITPAFTATSVDSHIDYITKQGHFKSIGGSSKAYFPVNEFMTVMDQFIWDIEKNEIEVGIVGQTGSDRVGSEYISTSSKQDSLRFTSYSSGYSLDDFILRCYDVDSINVANGTIFPDTTVLIRAKADIDPLYNIVIKADNTNRYHKITDAIVKVKGRNEIAGTAGHYDYVFLKNNPAGGKDTVHFKIIFNEITSTPSSPIIICYAKDTLKGIDLNDQFLKFQGVMQLETDKKHPVFKGSLELNNGECTTIMPERIVFEGTINPDSVLISLPKDPVNIKNEKITAGFFSTLDSVYTTFMSKRRDRKDLVFLSDSTEKVLYYDYKNNQYLITAIEKYQNPDTLMPLLAYNNRYCLMKAEGVLDIGANIGQVEMKTIGQVRQNQSTNKIGLETYLSFNFFFNDKATKQMVDEIKKSTFLNAATTTSIYTNAIEYLLGNKRAEKLREEISQYGELKKIPIEMEKSFVFTDVILNWDNKTSSYKSEGDLNLISIKGEQFNKSIPGYIEIVKKTAGDELYILLEPSLSEWYFFQYAGGTMFSLSSSSEYNAAIKDVKDSERTQKHPKLEEYKYNIGDNETRVKFIERVTGKAFEDESDVEEVKDKTEEDKDPVEDEGFEGN